MGIIFDPAVSEPSGGTAEYGRFHQMFWCSKDDVGYIRFSMWRTKSAHDDGYNPVLQIKIPLKGEDIITNEITTQLTLSDYLGDTEIKIQTAMLALAPVFRGNGCEVNLGNASPE